MVCVCSHAYVYMCVHVPRQMCVEFEDNFQELVLSLYGVGFGTSTQLIKSQGMHLYPLSRLVSCPPPFQDRISRGPGLTLCVVKDNLDPLILLPPLRVWDYKCAPHLWDGPQGFKPERQVLSQGSHTPAPASHTTHVNLLPYLGLLLADILLSLAGPMAFMNSPFAWGWGHVDLGAEVNLKDRPPQKESEYLFLEPNMSEPQEPRLL